MKKLVISKNRGWRGLSCVEITDSLHRTVMTRIFSFSQDMWDDLIRNHRIVVQDGDVYHVLRLDDTECERYLPKPTQQRSVLINAVLINIDRITTYSISGWAAESGSDFEDFWAIKHFIHNTNNHTKSDWNYIGVRVVPEI